MNEPSFLDARKKAEWHTRILMVTISQKTVSQQMATNTCGRRFQEITPNGNNNYRSESRSTWGTPKHNRSRGRMPTWTWRIVHGSLRDDHQPERFTTDLSKMHNHRLQACNHPPQIMDQLFNHNSSHVCKSKRCNIPRENHGHQATRLCEKLSALEIDTTSVTWPNS